jgi:hypothetical protein
VVSRAFFLEWSNSLGGANPDLFGIVEDSLERPARRGPRSGRFDPRGASWESQTLTATTYAAGYAVLACYASPRAYRRGIDSIDGNRVYATAGESPLPGKKREGDEERESNDLGA